MESREDIPEVGGVEIIVEGLSLGQFDLSDFLDEVPEVPEGEDVQDVQAIEEDVVNDASCSSSCQLGNNKENSRWLEELKSPEGEMKSREELKDFVLSTRNPNTVRKTNQVVRSFQKWLRDSCYEHRDIEDIGPQELDNFMCNYLLSKKKKDGTDHQPDTLTSIHRAIIRHLKHTDYPVDPMDDKNFNMSRDVLAAKRTNLKKEGYGNRPNKSEAFDDDEIEAMWECGALGEQNPTKLQNTVFWYLTIGFGLRGCDESRKMCWGDVTLHTGKDEIEYIEFNERSSKTRQGGAQGGHVRAFAPKIFATGTSRCPIYYYKLFANRRPDKSKTEQAPFYLTVRHGATITDTVGYTSAPMGINKMREIVKGICAEAGIEGRHTNHSLRKTSCQTLMNKNVPPVMVAQLSGHKNLASLNNYATASKNQQRAMSDILTRKRESMPTCEQYAAIESKRTPPSHGSMLLPPAPYPMQLPVPARMPNVNPMGLDRLAQTTSGMFAGAYVSAPITLNFNYHVSSTSSQQVNCPSSPVIPGNPSDNV